MFLAPTVVRIVVGLSLMTCACGSPDREQPPRDRCERVRDRIVELQLSPDDEDRVDHARVIRRALGDEFLHDCSEMSSAQTDCILAARSARAVLDCSTDAPIGAK